MGKKQKRTLYKHSLVFQQLRMTMLAMLVVGGVFLVIIIVVYCNSMFQRVLINSGHRVNEALTGLYHVGDPVSYVRQVQKVYQEHGGDQSDPEYQKYYSAITSDSGYRRMAKLLHAYSENKDVDVCFLAFTDAERDDALVLVMGDEGNSGPYYAGISSVGFGKAFKRAVGSDDERISNTYYFLPETGLFALSSIYLDEDHPDAGSLYCVINTDDVVKSVIEIVIQYIVLMVLTTTLEMLIVYHRMNSTLVDPIERIVTAIQNYSRDKDAGAVNKHHFASLDIHTGNEIERLASVLVSMEDDLYTYMKDLTRITSEQEREETQLRMAAQIQKGALPDVFPAFPEREEFDIYASTNPARVVGGDFYDFFLVDDDHLCMVIADVSDKGVPAALFMMVCKTIVQGYLMTGNSPAWALQKANEMICKQNKMGMFVTVWAGVLEISTGILTAANAGHEYPVITNVNDDLALYNDPHGFVLGGMIGMEYQDYVISLRPGTRVFVYTDGVPEATDAGGKMLGIERMIEVLNQHNNGTPRELLEDTYEEVNKFVGDAEQFDDITMLCLEYRGAEMVAEMQEKGKHEQ